ncbi:MAG: phosphate ABC transporter substrate-binding protein, partial [Vallitaleaceae bacterium]|nr:phosphate ABC transporter substrate-binding protein [Vallitaleaceae bacterium]
FALTACSGEEKEESSNGATETTTETTTEATTETTTEATTEATTETTTEAEVAVLVGDVTVSGSTSVEKIGKAAGVEFMALNPGVNFSYEGIGSSAGIENGNTGTTMIGTSSRGLKEAEEGYGLTVKTLAFDGIAVVVHPSNEVADLSVEQVKAIFKGEITNWSEVGGKDAAISVVSREDGSGTRGAFEEIVGFEGELSGSALVKDGNGNVQATVASDEDSIGYVSFTYIDETIKAVKVEGVDATVENVLNETFPISRPFLMVYHDENLSDAAKAFVDFVMSEAGQNIVQDNGGIRVDGK